MTKKKKKNNTTISFVMISIFFLITYLMGYIKSDVIKLIINMLFLGYVLYIYKDIFKKDIKDFKKNKKKCIKNILLNFLLFTGVILLSNFIMYHVFNGISVSENDYYLRLNFNSSKLVFALLTILYYPLVEGIVFRKAIRDIIDDKWIFIIFSSLVYYFFNIMFTSLSLYNVFVSLTYFFAMMVLSNMYYKNNNFLSTVIVMSLYNLITVLITI